MTGPFRYFFLVITAFYIVLSVCGCKTGNARSVHANGLTVEVKKIPTPQEDPGEISYSARLVPDRDTLTNVTLKTDLLYRMDSCFYLQNGLLKLFPKIVEPVANGAPGSFEYLLSFEGITGNTSAWHVVYKDKYLTHYTFNLPSLTD